MLVKLTPAPMDAFIMEPDEVLSWRMRVVIFTTSWMSSVRFAVNYLTMGSLKPNFNIPFTHALHYIFEDFTLVTITKVISLKMYCDVNKTCLNGKCKLASSCKKLNHHKLSCLNESYCA